MLAFPTHTKTSKYSFHKLQKNTSILKISTVKIRIELKKDFLNKLRELLFYFFSNTILGSTLYVFLNATVKCCGFR